MSYFARGHLNMICKAMVDDEVYHCLTFVFVDFMSICTRVLSCYVTSEVNGRCNVDGAAFSILFYQKIRLSKGPSKF